MANKLRLHLLSVLPPTQHAFHAQHMRAAALIIITAIMTCCQFSPHHAPLSLASLMHGSCSTKYVLWCLPAITTGMAHCELSIYHNPVVIPILCDQNSFCMSYEGVICCITMLI